MKQLKNYTLGEVQDICNGRNRVCKNEDDECLFCKDHANRFCKVHSNSPSDWKLKERKYFSNDQLAVMRELYRIGFRFVAQDEDACLYAYSAEPHRDSNGYVGGSMFHIIPSQFFQQIMWEDEPICIADYIKVK